MNILSVDTSTKRCFVALKGDDFYLERIIEGGFSPSEDLLHEIKDMLSRKGLSLTDLDLLVATKGPGSFTGLRIALATLKGIRAASDRAKLVSVPTLDVMAKAASIPSLPVLPVIDARKGRYYAALYRDGECIIPPGDISLDKLAENLPKEKIVVTGSDACKALDTLKGLGVNASLDEASPRPLSDALIALGLEKLEKVGEDDIGEGPEYIRKSDAEEALEKKAKGEGK